MIMNSIPVGKIAGCWPVVGSLKHQNRALRANNIDDANLLTLSVLSVSTPTSAGSRTPERAGQPTPPSE